MWIGLEVALDVIYCAAPLSPAGLLIYPISWNSQKTLLQSHAFYSAPVLEFLASGMVEPLQESTAVEQRPQRAALYDPDLIVPGNGWGSQQANSKDSQWVWFLLWNRERGVHTDPDVENEARIPCSL
jgi:hypothetical protein